MNHKSIFRLLVYCLTVLMLVVNVSGVAASPTENLKQTGNVITVSPTGKDDTANIQRAFKLAKAAGSGSTVQLAAGKFTIRFIDVRDFDGYFKGAGQGKTFIDTFAGQECQKLVDHDVWPSLLHFERGYPRISELSFNITPAAPCKPYSVEYFADNKQHTYLTILMLASSSWNPKNDCAVIQKEKVSAALTNVTFEGATGQADPTNVMVAITMGGAVTTHLMGSDCGYQSKYGQGAFRVTHSTFRNIGAGINPYGMYNSPVVLSDNSFDTIRDFGILASDLSGSESDISHNCMKNMSGLAIFVWQGGASVKPFLKAASVFNIHDNEISILGNGNGLVIWDYDNLGLPPFSRYPSTGKRAVLIVRDNRITLNSADAWGIWMEGLDDPQIINNKITGSGGLAIIAGMNGPTRRGLIKDNNLSGFTPSNGSPIKILLEAGTEKYRVSGVPVEAVQDNGTGNQIAH